jgi:hypothetical protein
MQSKPFRSAEAIVISKTGNWTADGPVPQLRPQKRRRFTMKTIQTARHAAHASAHDHPGRFYSGLVVAALGTGLWLAEVARMLMGSESVARECR